jgi:hypothetical protein
MSKEDENMIDFISRKAYEAKKLVIVVHNFLEIDTIDGVQ